MTFWRPRFDAVRSSASGKDARCIHADIIVRSCDVCGQYCEASQIGIRIALREIELMCESDSAR